MTSDQAGAFNVEDLNIRNPAGNDRSARLVAVKSAIRRRSQRKSHFKAELFADPGWAMLLALYAATLSDRRLSASHLCNMAGVPGTTALRWIGKLESEGLLLRRTDPLDARRLWVELSDSGLKAMDAYWDEISNAS